MDELDLDAKLTIAQLVVFFHGELTHRAIDQWVRRDRVPHTKDRRGRILIRLGDALQAEADVHTQARGRPRKAQLAAA